MPRVKKESASPKVTKKAPKVELVEEVEEELTEASELEALDVEEKKDAENEAVEEALATEVYKLEISFNDSVYKGEGESMVQLLTDFVNSPDFPFAIKTRVFIKYSKGEVEAHKFLNLPRARFVFQQISSDPHDIQFWADRLIRELTA